MDFREWWFVILYDLDFLLVDMRFKVFECMFFYVQLYVIVVNFYLIVLIGVVGFCNGVYID